MKVFVEPIGLHSRAMIRIARALRRHAPAGIEFALTPLSADVVVMYVIGLDALQFGRDLRDHGKKYVAMQCCTGGMPPAGEPTAWDEFWRAAELVWSYYDLNEHAKSTGFRFYHSPLGVDSAFISDFDESRARGNRLLTSGYSNGPGREVIEDAWMALARVGGSGVHLGPKLPEGMTDQPHGWNSREGISDAELAAIYRDTKYVAAMRYVEGFEMPVVEALACGARPIVFDRRDMRQWYDGYAHFVPELTGEPLVAALVEIMSQEPLPVPHESRAKLLEMFSWERICAGFWRELLEPRVLRAAEVTV